MQHTPARLTRSLLAAYRPGALVAVDEGAAAGIPRKRPVGYQLRAVEVVSGAPAAARVAGPGVAILEIRGVMTQREEWFDCGEASDYESIAARFCDAQGDPGVGSIVVDADTPGGDLPGLEEGIEIMLAAKLASGKPVVGYVGALCASAGVWLLSLLCDVIFIHLSARMGSIGVVICHETDARHAEREGFDRTIVRDPPGKMVPNPGELLDELGRGRLQELVTEARARFVAAVATSRRLDPAAILAWNGAMFTGAAAVPALADGLGSLESAIAYAGSLASLQEAA